MNTPVISSSKALDVPPLELQLRNLEENLPILRKGLEELRQKLEPLLNPNNAAIDTTILTEEEPLLSPLATRLKKLNGVLWDNLEYLNRIQTSLEL
jgi:hypothetical protein